ncbi:hypothetical protein OOT00_12995 [Desulfobotulus sp. H1]|uniref:Uncharacterized protein n=1 Tax=Desulfobotulus pelophilus TaxID=2823377 RepID=A0ABT3NBQ9_9BACT|nr:hypothetical protein [Desulfobotulus pelophilus]MCW7754902.1 hypothetical protein [Desulfobotulus pelophilus]
MHAIKFKAQIKSGRIDVPEAYRYLESRTIEVIALCIEETPALSGANSLSPTDSGVISDEELNINWKKLASEGLAGLNDAGCKMTRYTEDRGRYLAEKYQ